uniref:tetraacyldisaccharide 4'-kinase n=1 Tax=Compsopogon caeruleus TaxID=31354 RepID=A0A7S1XBW4_9RHOD|mmetsp:Transcript_12084/g.24611  ORF Transcript_12084/g.24611 Transcript_12084/m.24611 type:complete len:268 (+) Transcript_12084:304-1107(+)
MMKQRLVSPILAVGRDRYRVGRQALQAQDQQAGVVVLLDDGHQHYSLHRDVNIVMVDAMDPFGPTGALIPAGTLRETPTLSLARADVVVVHNVNHITNRRARSICRMLRRARGLGPEIPILTSSFRPSSILACSGSNFESRPAQELSTRNVVSIAGTGNPHSFHRTAQQLVGRPLLRELSFPDHHRFSAPELERVLKGILPDSIVLTTEKDYFRDPHVLWQATTAVQCHLWVLRGQLESPSLFPTLEALLHARGISSYLDDATRRKH